MTTLAYLRASPGCNDLQVQHEAVHEWARANDITISSIYRDGPGRSSVGRAALLRAVEIGGITRVLVARPCRLAPSLPALLPLLRQLRDVGVTVIAASDPAGMPALMEALDSLDAVRRGLHIEAVAIGRASAQRRGIRFGRPPIEEGRVVRVRAALAAGASVRKAARVGGVGVATAYRLARQSRCEDPQDLP